MGPGAVKKQKKRKSQPHRLKAAAPLPLDVSRSHRPPHTNIRKPHSAPGLSSRLKSAYALNVFRPLSRWRRITRLTTLQRADLAMLSLPFFLISLSIAVAHWTDGARSNAKVATPPSFGKRALFGLPHTPAPVAPVGPSRSVAAQEPPPGPITAEVRQPPGQTSTQPPAFDLMLAQNPATEAPAAVAPGVSVDETAPDEARATAGHPLGIAISSGAAPVENLPAASGTAETARSAEAPIGLPATNPPPQDLASLDVADGLHSLGHEPYQCLFVQKPAPARSPVTWNNADPESFGLALAAAARRQLEDFVIYNDRYTRMKYPMGDVHPMYGVCTDVIIRAYRTLDIDLQELVQTTKTGSGDPNIDHRRVDTLRKFFSRFGETLPISTFAEDYKPGDIVTYWRPQNRHSRTHIAIVSDLTAPSGRPLIIHNRGWGPQQEDGLFVDQITGHYRFTGLKTSATQSILRRPKGIGGLKTSTLRDVVRAAR